MVKGVLPSQSVPSVSSKGEYLRLLAELIGKPVIPMGFLPRGENLDRREITYNSWGEMFDWLDEKDPKSVVGLVVPRWVGSVIETLQFGHTLVVLPFSGDHGFNARLVVEKGLAMEVDHGEDGSFKRDDIAKSLRQSMVLEEGEEMRARSRAAAVFAGDRKLQDHYVEEFVEFLKMGLGS
ncbi:hypothetical protein Acr_00g0005080 [Actinidia rufa]|uniref:UDP-Glycosyltransferase superfamily protein n=1 Tax=Actinidia rufa TaxID=165716 RepID=A0A7J0D7N6_9ERIC|nr:hypothetical protein Acr_00g0005080 [Actinidia rufa]